MSGNSAHVVPKNLYCVQTSLPWTFRQQTTNYCLPLSEIVSADDYHADSLFPAFYNTMREQTVKGDKNGSPEALTLEEAAELAISRGPAGNGWDPRMPGRTTMVAAMIYEAPKGAFLEAPKLRVRQSAVKGRYVAFPWETDWTVAMEKGSTVAERIRSSLASRDKEALFLVYTIWDTELDFNVYKQAYH